MQTTLPSSQTWNPFPPGLPPIVDLATTLPEDNQKQIKRWVFVSEIVAALAGAIRAADQIVDSKVHKKETKAIIDASLHTAYAVFGSLNNAIADEVTKLKTGEAPAHVLPPITIPPWKPDAPPQTLWADLWQALLPALEAAYNAGPKDGKLGIVLYAAIQAGQSVVSIMDHYFPKG
ncbi:MAG: hypothetical protein AB8H79_12575 [Myxococcota bacterium]